MVLPAAAGPRDGVIGSPHTRWRRAPQSRHALGMSPAPGPPAARAHARTHAAPCFKGSHKLLRVPYTTTSVVRKTEMRARR